MRVYDAKNIRRYDKLAEKRRRVWFLKILFFIGLAIALTGISFYLLFFSGFLDIKNISINGLDQVGKEEFETKLNARLDSKWLRHVEDQKNLIFFDADDFKAKALAAFPEIKEISIDKNMPHTLNVNVVERKVAGIWCFASCKYFDEEGNLWGQAARSAGFLILNVDDLRRDVDKIDIELLNSIALISSYLKNINISVSNFTIPEDFIGDLRVTTSRRYELLLSAGPDTASQLKTLEILLAQKQNDPDFKPQYIDLRINGRVYYK
ncbi:MAG: FtsQ-type POTRA domain-containing protein [Patescibacteria group bacterium]